MNTSNAIPFSIYIPRVSAGYNAPLLEHIFNRDIGAVERVDLLPCSNQKFFDRPQASNRFNKAFIHFKYLYDYQISKLILTTLEQGNSYHWHIQPREYFILLKNRDPVPSTILNIHQVVDNCRLLEQEVETQKREIDVLKDTVADLLEKNDRMIQEFMQVLARVYTTSEADRIFNAHNFMKFGNFCNTRYLLNQNDDGSDEYLRQHAKEWKYGEFAEPSEDEDASYESSSMPSLIEEYRSNHDSYLYSPTPSSPRDEVMTIDELSLSSDEDKPRGTKMTMDELSTSTTSSTVSVSAIPVKERIRNSAELCGNN